MGYQRSEYGDGGGAHYTLVLLVSGPAVSQVDFKLLVCGVNKDAS